MGESAATTLFYNTTAANQDCQFINCKAMASPTPLELELAQRQTALGFDEWMEAALYHPEFGFFEASGEAGRRGKDFLTSPEVGPLFGAVLARAIDACWHRLGCPKPFVVVEGGAGVGTLAASIFRAGPKCLDVLRYVLVERSAKLRFQQEHLAGAAFSSLADLPDTSFDSGMVIANELLDNLPFKILELTAGGWQEVGVQHEVVCMLDHSGPAPQKESGLALPEENGHTPPESQNTMAPTNFGEQLRPLDEATQQLADQLAPHAEIGTRIPLQSRAKQWVDQALGLLGQGEVLIFDYGGTTAELGRRGGWLRTYCQHQRGRDPLVKPGLQDITSDVAFDQLPTPTRLQAQAQFLKLWGIEELVEQGNQIWQAQAAAPTAESLIAGSRGSEAKQLCNPETFGNYKVASWEI